jgi:hypothetical protein
MKRLIGVIGLRVSSPNAKKIIGTVCAIVDFSASDEVTSYCIHEISLEEELCLVGVIISSFNICVLLLRKNSNKCLE